MRIRFSGGAAFIAALAVATPITAQEFEWLGDRPDAYAPQGVIVDHNLDVGALLVGYRFGVFNLSGLQAGQFEIPLAEVLDVFESTPFQMQSQSHLLTLQYSPTTNVSVLARVPFMLNTMDDLGRDGSIVGSESSGLGDFRADAIINVYDKDSYRAHLSGGVSVPIGSITETVGETGTARLPYQMQNGSGTFDVMPGITVEAMNEYGSVGLQAMGTLRIGDNSEGYTLGNRAQVSAWAGFAMSEQLSLSARFAWQQWDRISGSDAAFTDAVNSLQSPAFFTELSGGSRLDMPLGFNLFMKNGPLAGHRFSLEWVIPVDQDLDGPQLMGDWGINIGWQKLVGLGR
jgi:hypothetical protein